MWKFKIDYPIILAVSRIDGMEITDGTQGYDKLLKTAEKRKSEYPGRNIGDIQGVQKARRLFRQIGIDPTRHRPSSEALLRRALKGLDYYKINTLVDTGNWCSLDFLLPICVYDADKITGDILIRLGREGESYIGHTRKEVNLYNRYSLSDEKGPFGSPITDSVRTAVDTNTVNGYLVIFAPGDYDAELLLEQMKIFTERAVETCGGKVGSIDILKN